MHFYALNYFGRAMESYSSCVIQLRAIVIIDAMSYLWALLFTLSRNILDCTAHCSPVVGNYGLRGQELLHTTVSSPWSKFMATRANSLVCLCRSDEFAFAWERGRETGEQGKRNKRAGREAGMPISHLAYTKKHVWLSLSSSYVIVYFHCACVSYCVAF